MNPKTPVGAFIIGEPERLRQRKLSANRTKAFPRTGGFLRQAPRSSPRTESTCSTTRHQSLKTSIRKTTRRKIRSRNWIFGTGKILCYSHNSYCRPSRERRRSYLAVYNLRTKKASQLATKDIPDVTVDAKRDSDVTVGLSDVKYRKTISWDLPGYRDVYLINLRTGKTDLVLERIRFATANVAERKVLDLVGH